MKRLLVLMWAVFATGAGTDSKVEVCHIPPGNAGNYHTLTIPVSALKAHLGHGDLTGSCGNYCGLFCNTGNKCAQDNGTFDPATGRCICSSQPVDCSATSLCLTGAGCDPAQGCEYTVNVGAACKEDGNLCTGVGTCDATGVCQAGGAVDGCCLTAADCGTDPCVQHTCNTNRCEQTGTTICTPPSACEVGVCDSYTGSCLFTPILCTSPGLCMCGAQCVNTGSDANNCGACGAVCGAGTECVMGKCASPFCGNNVTEPHFGEVCDGADLPNPSGLGQATCADFYDSTGQHFDVGRGTLLCSACQFDLSLCQRCGNGLREGTEPCDGTDFGGRNCASELGSDWADPCNGPDPQFPCIGAQGLTCTAGCTIETNYCLPRCGNNHVDGSEQCDGEVPGSVTCAALKSEPGWTGIVTCNPPNSSGDPNVAPACRYNTDGCSPTAPDDKCLDADGTTMRDIVSPQVGDLLITEVMNNPSATETYEEWFEVLVIKDVDLVSMSVCSPAATCANSTAFSTTDCQRVTAGTYLIFANGTLAQTGLPKIDYTFTFTLVNSASTVAVLIGGQLLDSAAWISSTIDGASRTLKHSKFDTVGNDTSVNFCNSTSFYNGTDKGTPGIDDTSCQ